MINYLLLWKLWSLDLAFLLLVAFAVYVFIRTPKQYYLKWALIPTALSTAIFSFILFGNILGSSYPSEKMPDNFVFLSYITVIQQDKPVALEIWVKANPTRLYRVPYSKKLEEQLRKAEKARASGNMVRFSSTNRSDMKEGKDSTNEEDSWAMDIFNPITVFPKDPDDAKSK